MDEASVVVRRVCSAEGCDPWPDFASADMMSLCLKEKGSMQCVRVRLVGPIDTSRAAAGRAGQGFGTVRVDKRSSLGRFLLSCLTVLYSLFQISGIIEGCKENCSRSNCCRANWPKLSLCVGCQEYKVVDPEKCLMKL